MGFENVIGYESVKQELMQIVDMLKNRERYERMGARLPHGVLLSGEPGLGKTLLARSFIEHSGLRTYTLRRFSGSGFVDEIADTFRNAAENAPSIVFLDDVDKYAEAVRIHSNAPEFVAVQSGIDEVSDSEVFVLATANDVDKLPESLIRSGRFDRHIILERPIGADAEMITAHYLKGKRVSPSVNFEDLTKMIQYSSCSELETIINEAAVRAAYRNKEQIEMADLVQVVLQKQYNVTDVEYTVTDEDEAIRTAYHEAGHALISEILEPGSVGFASIRPDAMGGIGGFVHRAFPVRRRPHSILISLGSKAAVELNFSDRIASGCSRDLHNAYRLTYEGLSESGTAGLGMLDFVHETSESLTARQEAAVQVQLEQYMMRARDIILKNRAFLEALAKELKEKGLLLYSDVQRIKQTVGVVPVAA